MRVVACLVVMCACSDAPPSEDCAGDVITPYVHAVELAHLPQLDVAGYYEGRMLVLYLGFGTETAAGPAPLRDANGDKYCPQLAPSFTAALETLAPTSVGAGGWVCGMPLGAVCSAPSMSFQPPSDFQPADANVILADDSTSITIPLGDTLVTRTASPVGAADWTFRAGTQVSFQWSPATDLTTFKPIMVDFDLPTTPVQGFEVDTGFAISGDTLSMTLPTTITGQGGMGITLAGTVNGIYIEHVVAHSATVTP